METIPPLVTYDTGMDILIHEVEKFVFNSNLSMNHSLVHVFRGKS